MKNRNAMSLEIRAIIQSDENDGRSLWCAYLEYYETTVPVNDYSLRDICQLECQKCRLANVGCTVN